MTLDDWLHIQFRHPEVGFEPSLILETISKPDEVYRAPRGAIHALRRIDNHFLLVICELGGTEGGGFIRTAFHNKRAEKEKEVQSDLTTRTILGLDLRRILSEIERRYKVKLPRTILAIDYGERGDLYLRFKHVAKPVGEPSEDGLVVFFYEGEGNHVVAVEILDQARLLRHDKASF